MQAIAINVGGYTGNMPKNHFRLVIIHDHDTHEIPFDMYFPATPKGRQQLLGCLTFLDSAQQFNFSLTGALGEVGLDLWLENHPHATRALYRAYPGTEESVRTIGFRASGFMGSLLQRNLFNLSRSAKIKAFHVTWVDAEGFEHLVGIEWADDGQLALPISKI